MGQPSLDVIHPIAAWTLPAGVAYSPYQDQFVDGAGIAVTVAYAGQPKTALPFLPLNEAHAVALSIPGITTTDGYSAVILWSAEAEAVVKTSWGVLISNRLYRVRRWTLEPMGVATPIQISIELSEAD